MNNANYNEVSYLLFFFLAKETSRNDSALFKESYESIFSRQTLRETMNFDTLTGRTELFSLDFLPFYTTHVHTNKLHDGKIAATRLINADTRCFRNLSKTMTTSISTPPGPTAAV